MPGLLSLVTYSHPGKPVAYKLVPTAAPLLLAHPSSLLQKRGAFASKNLWWASLLACSEACNILWRHKHLRAHDCL